jgi:hypothetical protein
MSAHTQRKHVHYLKKKCVHMQVKYLLMKTVESADVKIYILQK